SPRSTMVLPDPRPTSSPGLRIDHSPASVGPKSTCGYNITVLESQRPWTTASSQTFSGYHSAMCCRKATDERMRRMESMQRHRLFSTVLLPVLLLAVVTSCAPVRVQQTTLKSTYTDVRADVLTTGELSQLTQQVLRMRGLHAEAQDPARAFQALE